MNQARYSIENFINYLSYNVGKSGISEHERRLTLRRALLESYYLRFIMNGGMRQVMLGIFKIISTIEKHIS